MKEINGYLPFFVLLSIFTAVIIIANSTCKTQEYTKQDTPTNHTCLFSPGDCLFLITEKTGKTPHLSSFARSNEQTTYDVNSRKPFLIPNIVHVIRFGKKLPFLFYHYVSLLGASQFLKPDLILVWTDDLPTGRWWTKVKENIANVYLIQTDMITTIGGKKIRKRWRAHASDYLRLQLLHEYGGIYIDNDLFPLRSFDGLRVHRLVLGEMENGDVANGVMLSEPNTFFMAAWLESYNTFYPDKWVENSVFTARRLVKLFPHLVHLERTSLAKPTSSLALYRDHVPGLTPWNYAVHLWDKGVMYVPGSEEELAGYDCTVGDAMRFILYGDTRLRSNKTTNGLGKRIFTQL